MQFMLVNIFFQNLLQSFIFSVTICQKRLEEDVMEVFNTNLRMLSSILTQKQIAKDSIHQIGLFFITLHLPTNFGH